MIRQAREEGTDAIVEAMLPKLLSPTTLEAKPDVISHARQIMANTPTGHRAILAGKQTTYVTLAPILDAGHLAPLENPQVFNEDLGGFLGSLGN
jgi:hypothetical protein